jgi:hypothetical protein
MSAVLVLTLAWAAGCAVRRGAGAEHHRIPTVAAGSARFQILSPTLIRTEYASDRKFVDQPTFNVIGRGNFAPADYTVTSVDGWLTITTSAITLRYKTDSGPFTPRNLTVQLKSGDQDVTATPWQRPTCVVGVICEAEELTPTGAAVERDHRGYSGAGFLAGFSFAGDGLTTDVDADSPGRYQFVVRYANAQLGEEVHIQPGRRRLPESDVDLGADRGLGYVANGRDSRRPRQRPSHVAPFAEHIGLGDGQYRHRRCRRARCASSAVVPRAARRLCVQCHL